jgi:hypothetical protein
MQSTGLGEMWIAESGCGDKEFTKPDTLAGE